LWHFFHLRHLRFGWISVLGEILALFKAAIWQQSTRHTAIWKDGKDVVKLVASVPRVETLMNGNV